MRAPSFPRVTLGLPDWVEEFVSDLDRTYPTEEDRMRLVIELSRLNVIHATGGPFGAGIFDLSTNRLLAPGVNLVTTSNLSIVHAEIVAIMVAQQVLGHFDLGRPAAGVRSPGRGRELYRLRRGTEIARLGRSAGATRDLRGKGYVPRGGRGGAQGLRREWRFDLQRPSRRLRR